MHVHVVQDRALHAHAMHATKCIPTTCVLAYVMHAPAVHAPATSNLTLGTPTLMYFTGTLSTSRLSM